MIVRIDMHLRDERLLEWLLEHDNQRIPAHKIAVVFKCHQQTAMAMVRRLELAGYIEVKRSRRGGHRYRVIKL
jgi:DNA-binding MarR family transcriptional regulator